MRRQIPCAACAEVGKHSPAKYKCPACGIGSCSLACVNHHKATTKCTGIRNRAAAVRKADYNDTVFISDYTLLEDAARQLRAAARLRRQVNDPIDSNYKTTATSKGRMTLLAREAAARNTDLRFLPDVYSRHRRNATYAKRCNNSDQRTLFWSLDVHADIDGDVRQLRLKSCCESERIGTIVRAAITSLQSKRRGSQAHNDLFNAANEDLAIFLRNETVLAAQSDVVHLPAFRRHFGIGGTRGAPLKDRASNGTIGTAGNMKSTNGTSELEEADDVNDGKDAIDVRKFIAIDPSLSLRKALEARCVVEFPLIYIALKGSASAKKMEMECCGIFQRPEALAGSSDDAGPADDDDDDDDDDVDDDESVVEDEAQANETVEPKPGEGDKAKKEDSNKVADGKEDDGDESDDDNDDDDDEEDMENNINFSDVGTAGLNNISLAKKCKGGKIPKRRKLNDEVELGRINAAVFTGGNTVRTE